MAKLTMGEFLATLRKANGYTQQDVAEKLNISDRTLSSWETGRTAPDLLSLPALADLYGVTVDEILRGERKQSGEPAAAELSDKAHKDLRKNKYAKYKGKRILLLGLGFLGALLFLTGCAVPLYTSSPLWLDIILMVLGAGGNLACVIVLLYFDYNLYRSEGIVFDEDYNAENKPFALTVRHSTSLTLIFNSLPYILGAIVFLVVFFACGFYDYQLSVGGVSVKINYTTPTAVLVSINALFGLLLLISGACINAAALKKAGSEEQLTARKSNAKIFAKTYGFGAIPIAIALILYIVFATVPIQSNSVIYSNENLDEFKAHMQTLTVTEDDICDLPAGEYVLNFPEEAETRKNYDLGNGFTGAYLGYTTVNFADTGTEYHYAEWEIEPPHESVEQGTFSVWRGLKTYAAEKDGDGVVEVINVRYYYDTYLLANDNFDNSLFDRNYEIWLTNKGVYEYVEEKTYFLGQYFAFAAAFVAVASLVPCTVVFFKKRKKIKYGF